MKKFLKISFRYFLKMHALGTLVIGCVVSILFNFMTIGMVIEKVQDKTYEHLQTTLKGLYLTYNKDLGLLCKVSNCDAILLKEESTVAKYERIDESISIYKNIDNKQFLEMTETLKREESADIAINYEDIFIHIFINNPFLEDYRVSIFIGTSIVYCLVWVLIWTIITLIRIPMINRNNNILKLEFETRLQKELTESIHHEFKTPIALIESYMENILLEKYRCDARKDIDGVCDRNNIGRYDYCKGCPLTYENNKQREVYQEAYNGIVFQIQVMKSILRVMANMKHIKYTNGNVSIETILKNVINSKNIRDINKQFLTIVDPDSIREVSVGGELNNGEILSVLNNLVLNSVEANSTKITFKPEITNDGKYLNLYVIDNGSGIKNKHNVYDCNNKDIWVYGYTTKERSDRNVATNFFTKFLYKIFDVDYDVYSTRGSGLSLCRNLLAQGGGKIELVDTSERGTTFCITIPIKPRRKDNKDDIKL